MAEPDEKQTEATFKRWVNETLDEREARAVTAKEEADKKAADEAAARRTHEPLSLIRSFIGI